MATPAQGAVVRRIFEWSAEGWGITRSAKELNAEGISPPRGGGHGWAPTAIREMPHNDLHSQSRALNEAEVIPQLTPPFPYLLSGLGRCACRGGPIIAVSRHDGRRRGYFYGSADNWNRNPAICSSNLHLPQAILDEAVLDAIVHGPS